MNHTWLHDPNISKIDEQGNLRVDLTALAIAAGAPLTPQTYGRLSLMVQRFIRELDPAAECRHDLHDGIAAARHKLLIRHYRPKTPDRTKP